MYLCHRAAESNSTMLALADTKHFIIHAIAAGKRTLQYKTYDCSYRCMEYLVHLNWLRFCFSSFASSYFYFLSDYNFCFCSFPRTTPAREQKLYAIRSCPQIKARHKMIRKQQWRSHCGMLTFLLTFSSTESKCRADIFGCGLAARSSCCKAPFNSPIFQLPPIYASQLREVSLAQLSHRHRFHFLKPTKFSLQKALTSPTWFRKANFYVARTKMLRRWAARLECRNGNKVGW